MPRRKPIDPQGYYHVGSRGNYGQDLFRTPEQHELFLMLYARKAKKYGWRTLEWILMRNHHHFVIQLTDGGLSEGMRELHGEYSRRIHAIYGMTGQGHLVRHAFFARQLKTEGEVFVACSYVDLNAATKDATHVLETPWGGYRATIGLEHPRPFHQPSALLELISPSPAIARSEYERFVSEGLVLRRRASSPNDEGERRG